MVMRYVSLKKVTVKAIALTDLKINTKKATNW